MSWKTWNAGIASAALVAAFVGTSAPPAFAGESVTAAQILDALKLPKRNTRGLTSSTRESAAAAGCTSTDPMVSSVRNRPTRSLSKGERTEVAALTKSKPNIDLAITFEYKSAQLTPESVATVDALGAALTDPEMKNCVFVIGGHTDAKGSEVYNQELSERRADTVRRFLVDKYNVTPDRLITIGYGKSHLKTANSPYAAENRRVQVVNTASR
jgi:outer membrane protein OmpA-like peptidoglycan-associated protein